MPSRRRRRSVPSSPTCQPGRRPLIGTVVAGILVAATVAAVIGCSSSASDRAPASARDRGGRFGGGATTAGVGAPPALEFLVATGDSTFWVRTGPGGATVRGAPLTLARYGGRFYEIYVGDDDRSFYDAVFVGQQVFRRDIVSGDSALVFADSAVVRAANRYASAHPDEEPLGDDEDASENPHTSLTSDVELLDALGPFVTYDFRTRREVRGDLEDASARRGVIDLRHGRPATVGDVAGDGRAPAVLAHGRRLFAAALDSVRVARDERALAARRALSGFVFDSSSFAVVDADGAPAVAFVALGRGEEAAGFTLPLPPIALDPPPTWWNEVRPVLAEVPAAPNLTAVAASSGSASRDSATDRWRRRDAVVSARYDSVSGAYALLLHASSPRGGAGDWPIRLVQGPVRQLYWLDGPSIDSTVRRALARAFDESALYSDEARTVAWRHSHGGPFVSRAALRRTVREVRSEEWGVRGQARRSRRR